MALKRQGAKLPADGSAGPTVIPVVDAVSSGEVDLEWGVRVVSAGLAVDLDAAILVDRMSAAHLKHTRAAIIAGERPDGGGEQAPLSARALAAPNRQSDNRGSGSLGWITGSGSDACRST